MERRGGSGMDLLTGGGGTETSVSSIGGESKETVGFTIEHFD